MGWPAGACPERPARSAYGLSSFLAQAVEVGVEKFLVPDRQLSVCAQNILLIFRQTCITERVFLEIEEVRQADIQASAEFFQSGDRGAGISQETIVEA